MGEQDLQTLGLPRPRTAASSQEEKRPPAGGFSCDSPGE